MYPPFGTCTRLSPHSCVTLFPRYSSLVCQCPTELHLLWSIEATPVMNQGGKSTQRPCFGFVPGIQESHVAVMDPSADLCSLSTVCSFMALRQGESPLPHPPRSPRSPLSRDPWTLYPYNQASLHSADILEHTSRHSYIFKICLCTCMSFIFRNKETNRAML